LLEAGGLRVMPDQLMTVEKIERKVLILWDLLLAA
jgi:hypothetical protein